MKVAAYYPIHYGCEYLDASIRSIDSLVDQIFILYTDSPTYGYKTDMKCPESEDEIKSIAYGASQKITWIKIDADNEGNHRGIIFNHVNDFDVLLSIDTDEIWDYEDLKRCIEETYQGETRERRVKGFIHFWKSFNHICQDNDQPLRFFNLRRNNGLSEAVHGKVYHFGYAQSDKIMDYKFEIHGHKHELKKDWLNEVYYPWKEGDKNLHPVSDMWEAIPFDKETLPPVLKSHPNFNKNIIS